MEGIREKRCNKCGEVFKSTLEFFDRCKVVKCGLNAVCKGCRKKIALKWRKENPDKKKAQHKRNYVKYKEYYIKNSQKWNKEHPKRRREIAKRYEKKYPEKLKAKIQRRKFSETIKKSQKEWRKNNPEKLRQYSNIVIIELRDSYINKMLSRYLNWEIPPSKIPKELINLKREQILLYRNLKKLKEVYDESNYSNPERIESKNAITYQKQNNNR